MPGCGGDALQPAWVVSRAGSYDGLVENPWFNPWFESIAVAQKRAKRRLPKSVYGALIA